MRVALMKAMVEMGRRRRRNPPDDTGVVVAALDTAAVGAGAGRAR